MGKSQRLTTREIGNVYRLLGECTELWADPVAWKTHLCRGATRLVGAESAVYIETVGGSQGWQHVSAPAAEQVVAAAVITGLDESARNHLQRTLVEASAGTVDVCGHDQKMELMRRNGYVACRRQRLVSDRVWYASPLYQEHRRPGGCDQFAIAMHVISPQRVNLVTLERPTGELPFDGRSIGILDLVTSELARLIGGRLATERHRSLAGLSPRCRQTLSCLLDGESEKQIEQRLGLSRSTVHQYVGQIYRHFDVRSRAELMAYFIRRRPRRNDSRDGGD